MLLDRTRAALETGPLCDACLGRAFADRSFGLSNDERGRALRVATALAVDEPPVEPAVENCWVCEGECARYDTWAERAVEALSGIEFETYQVGTRAPPLIEENDALLREEMDLPEDAGEPFKSECNREVGKRLGQRTGTEVDFDRPDVLCLLVIERETVDVQVNPAFVYGRYRKLERDIPQTEWPCSACGGTGTELAPGGTANDEDGDGPGPKSERNHRGERPCSECGGSGYRYDRSVEGSTVPVVRDAMDGSEGVFHGAGREDVDAKMLGTGRPFVIEVKHPRKRTVDPVELEEEINAFADGAVEVDGLRQATHEMVEHVKELDASKTYRLGVRFAEPVTREALEEALGDLEGATIEQRTPHRVDHRRADRVRVREVYGADGRLEPDGRFASDDVGGVADDRPGTGAGDVDGTETDGSEPARSRRATIEVHGAGGLYVKELMHGDDGRTEPSLAGLLGVDVEVTTLDVLAVEGEDGSFADARYLKADRNGPDDENGEQG